MLLLFSQYTKSAELSVYGTCFVVKTNAENSSSIEEAFGRYAMDDASRVSGRTFDNSFLFVPLPEKLEQRVVSLYKNVNKANSYDIRAIKSEVKNWEQDELENVMYTFVNETSLTRGPTDYRQVTLAKQYDFCLQELNSIQQYHTLLYGCDNKSTEPSRRCTKSNEKEIILTGAALGVGLGGVLSYFINNTKTCIFFGAALGVFAGYYYDSCCSYAIDGDKAKENLEKAIKICQDNIHYLKARKISFSSLNEKRKSDSYKRLNQGCFLISHERHFLGIAALKERQVNHVYSHTQGLIPSACLQHSSKPLFIIHNVLANYSMHSDSSLKGHVCDYLKRYQPIRSYYCKNNNPSATSFSEKDIAIGADIENNLNKVVKEGNFELLCEIKKPFVVIEPSESSREITRDFGSNVLAVMPNQIMVFDEESVYIIRTPVDTYEVCKSNNYSDADYVQIKEKEYRKSDTSQYNYYSIDSMYCHMRWFRQIKIQPLIKSAKFNCED